MVASVTILGREMKQGKGLEITGREWGALIEEGPLQEQWEKESGRPLQGRKDRKYKDPEAELFEVCENQQGGHACFLIRSPVLLILSEREKRLEGFE